MSGATPNTLWVRRGYMPVMRLYSVGYLLLVLSLLMGMPTARTP
jgi:hypothetical protein